MIEIKSCYGGRVLYSAEVATLKECVVSAITTEADLRGADLRGASLAGADLTGADLTGADLAGADLTGADLTGADLTGASLAGADLTGADLTGADLARASLAGVDLRGANLAGVDLRGANLAGVDLRGANLAGVDLNWQSHDLLAHILFVAAKSIEQRKVAGLILVSRDWCWKEFANMSNDPEFTWAIRTLAAMARPGDASPALLRSGLV